MFRVLATLALGVVSLSSLAQTPSQPSPQTPSQVSSQVALPSPAPKATDAVSPSPVGAAPAPSVSLSETLTAAGMFYRKGDLNAALAKYKSLLALYPKSPDAFAGLIHVYLKQKNVDDAEQVAEQGMKLSDSPRLRVARAEVWFREGRIHDAEAEWVQVINSGRNEARAYLGLSRVYTALAMYKSSKNMIDKAHALDPDDPDINEHWIRTLSSAERIPYLETSLAGENNWDADERTDVANYLEFLKERIDQKKTNPCRLVSQATASEAPMFYMMEDPKHYRGIGLTVALNGHKSSLLLDTGASGILVRRSVAEHAGISKISETKVGGIGRKGRRDAYIGIVDSIKIGNLEFQNCPVEVIANGSVAGDEGLIGADVFEDFLVELDFPGKKLKLSELPKRPGETSQNLALKNEDDDDSGDAQSGQSADDSAQSKSGRQADDSKSTPQTTGPQDRYIAPEMQSYTRFLRFGHDILVPTSIGNVPQKLFLLDSGSMFNFISPAAAREVTKVHGDADTIVEGISGRVDKVYSANKAVLTFGHLKQENQDITAFDIKPISDDAGIEISGFLGFVLLQMLDIKIDYRDALVDFQYDAKRWNR
jgi:tetratricopeptide (TPR) repeat protein